MSDTGTIVVVILFWISLGLIVYPFVRANRVNAEDAQTRAESRRAQQRNRLQALYEQCVSSLRDLDEDYALGRLEEDDYQMEREKWARRGVQALQVIRDLDAGRNLAIRRAEQGETDDQGELDQEVKQAIAGYAGSLQETS